MPGHISPLFSLLFHQWCSHSIICLPPRKNTDCNLLPTLTQHSGFYINPGFVGRGHWTSDTSLLWTGTCCQNPYEFSLAWFFWGSVLVPSCCGRWRRAKVHQLSIKHFGEKGGLVHHSSVNIHYCQTQDTPQWQPGEKLDQTDKENRLLESPVSEVQRGPC